MTLNNLQWLFTYKQTFLSAILVQLSLLVARHLHSTAKFLVVN